MSKTNDLRKLIESKLNGLKSAYPIKAVYYRQADEKKMYPHIVFDFENISLEGLFRDNYSLNVDIYDNEVKRIENIADDVEDVFHTENFPQTTILPTFFLESRKNLPDEERNIRHIVCKFSIQNYERN